MPLPAVITEEELLRIHSALHSECSKVELKGSTYTIFNSKFSKVRYVHVQDWKFLTQNPQKKSFYGFKAKAGSKMTWIVYPDELWSSII